MLKFEGYAVNNTIKPSIMKCYEKNIHQQAPQILDRAFVGALGGFLLFAISAGIVAAGSVEFHYALFLSRLVAVIAAFIFWVSGLFGILDLLICKLENRTSRKAIASYILISLPPLAWSVGLILLL